MKRGENGIPMTGRIEGVDDGVDDGWSEGS